ncbi:MAG: YdcH family protein [Acidobacteria bacterium]|nr:YdcH family protein [Acidobacteriota bacterium]MCI0720009.1 YdcH family protein [Acidobacteriota bacterium]
MELGTVDIKEHLLQSDEDFRRLAQKHHQYDEQLDRLVHKAHLSEEERVEEVNLKKMKLHVKDQMETMIQKYRQQAAKSSSAPAKS